MRVVAGTARGRRLQAPDGRDTRPTSDRVREALFSSLESLDAVRDAEVADLFAGTGALGIEALSRGAARVTFVDSSPGAATAIGRNLEATGLTSRATVVRADVLRWLGTPVRFDLVLADPPYSFEAWGDLGALVDAAVLVAESDREVDLGERWRVERQKRYGSTVVTIATSKGHS